MTNGSVSILRIIISYLIGLLTLLTPWSIRKFLYYKNKQRPTGKFWSPMFDKGLSIITATEEKEPEIKSQVFDFLAINDIEKEFHKTFLGKYWRYTCTAISPDALKRNLLLVAGPIPNDITREVLHRVDTRYTFRGNDIINKMDPNFSQKAEIENDIVVRDYGIITRCKNPFHGNRNVIIVSGCYGWGTWGALKALLDPQNLRFLSTKKAPYFQILVSVGVFRKLPQETILKKDTFITIGG